MNNIIKVVLQLEDDMKVLKIRENIFIVMLVSDKKTYHSITFGKVIGKH